MPKVSIIVPVYNVEKFLARCLDSIVGQSLRDIEIICVDDGSPDNSIDILNRYAQSDSRVKVIRQQNKGLGGARNTGIDAATGDYVGFVDSDDWIDSDFYEKLYEAAQRTGADIVCCSLLKHRPRYDKYMVRYFEERVVTDLQQRFDMCSCPPQFYTVNRLYRRGLLNDGRRLRFQEHVVFEDVEFTAEAIRRAGSIASVTGVCYHYVFNGTSIINSRQTPKKQLDRYNARRAFVEFADRVGLVIPRAYRNVPVRSYSVGPVCLLKIKERDGRRTYRLFDFLPVYMKKI